MSGGSRKILAKKNVLFGYLNKSIQMILEFVSRAFFIKYLGENLLGVNGVFYNVIQLLSLAELGMNNVVSYSFYEPLARNDEIKISALIRFYKRIYNGIAATVLTIGLLLFPFIEKIVNTDVEISHLNLIYLIFLADTVFSYLFVYKAILLNADQKGYINNSYTAVSNIVRILLQIISLAIFKNIFVYLIIRVIVNVCCNYLLSKRSEKEFSFIKQNDGAELQKHEKKSLVEVIKSGFIYKLSALLLNSTDNILISLILGTVWVGYVSNYDTIYAGLGFFYTVLFLNLTPSIGNLVATENAEKKFSIFRIMNFASSWLACVFAVCFFVLSKDFISLWLGEKFVLDKWSVLCKTVIVFISCSLQPIFSFREALGLYKKTKYMMLIAAIINIGLSIWLGFAFGLKGILLASVIAILSTYYWYEPYVLYNKFFFRNFSLYLLKKLYDFICLSLSVLCSSVIFTFWNTSNFLMWFFKATSLFCFVNILCLFAYGFFPEFKIVFEFMMKKRNVK